MKNRVQKRLFHGGRVSSQGRGGRGCSFRYFQLECSQGVGSNVDGGLTTSTWIASQAPCRWTAVSTTGRV